MKYLWCVDCTAIEQFDYLEDAIREFEESEDPIEIPVEREGKLDVMKIPKSSIEIMSEEAFNSI